MPLELLIGAAVGAGLASTPVRKVIRKGMVYSLAGALMAYDKVSGVAANFKGAKSEPAETEAPRPAAPQGSAAACDASPAGKPSAPAEPVSTP